jgi:hypothetical protein
VVVLVSVELEVLAEEEDGDELLDAGVDDSAEEVSGTIVVETEVLALALF